jgi:hypothetical protein
MKSHELKTDPDTFDAVLAGRKKFEIRYDDRGYQVGDLLVLRKTKHTGTQMMDGAPLEYVGAPLNVYVTHILRGPIYGIGSGWVCMSIEPRDTSNYTPKYAMDVLRNAMAADPEYAWSWQANIAMAFFDEAKLAMERREPTNMHALSNKAAARFMQQCFEVDLQKEFPERFK